MGQTAPTCELVVIVPARNEEQALPGCLASLVQQSGVGFVLGVEWHLIVVDDGSTDGTRRIAGALPQVIVLEAPAIDLEREHSGFNGKTHACWTGAQVAIERFQPKWLLFTDADTVHGQNSLSRAMREAEKHGAALLSYSPRQLTTGLVQRSVMPLIFSELASVYPPAKVSDPRERVAAANGQFLLVDRETYTGIGGHRAVGSDILEDVALARTVKRSGGALRFRYAPEMVSTRMYRDTPSLVEGWSKNLALLFPSPRTLALWRVLDFVLLFGLPVLAFAMARNPLRPAWVWQVVLVLWVRSAFRFYHRVARAHFPFAESLLSVLGLPLFVYLLLRSVRVHRSKRVAWKGRTYAGVR